jgi:hypothetical protein
VLAREQPLAQQSGSYEPQQQQQMTQNPCQVEFQRFIACAQNQTELTMCDQFHQALKDCKLLYSKFVMKVTIQTIDLLNKHCQDCVHDGPQGTSLIDSYKFIG